VVVRGRRRAREGVDSAGEEMVKRQNGWSKGRMVKRRRRAKEGGRLSRGGKWGNADWAGRAPKWAADPSPAQLARGIRAALAPAGPAPAAAAARPATAPAPPPPPRAAAARAAPAARRPPGPATVAGGDSLGGGGGGGGAPAAVEPFFIAVR
jgi:hypothetical protein